MKLPRKLKKAYKNMWHTKRALLNALRQTDYIESHCKFNWCYVGHVKMTFEDQRNLINKELKHPYPVTKWIRKSGPKYSNMIC